MIRFSFRAVRPDGERVSGEIVAVSEAAAVTMLAERRLMPLDIARPRGGVRRPTSWHALAAVFSGLGALLETGMPIDRALSAVQGPLAAPLQAGLVEVQSRVREGSGFATALGAAAIVPEYAIGMVRAGEAQGNLAGAVRRVANDFACQADLRDRMRSALLYPLFLLVAGTLSITVIVGVVIPRFAGIIADIGGDLPPSTRTLIALSAALRHHWLLLLAGCSAAPLAARLALTLPVCQRWLHAKLLQVPVIGRIRHSMFGARFARTMAGLLEAGVPILPAMATTGEGVADVEFARRARAAHTDVSNGVRFETALRRHGVLPSAALQLIGFGEESGQLAQFLAHAADREDSAAARGIAACITIMEPALILAFGALVAFVAVALLQAVYSVHPTGL